MGEFTAKDDIAAYFKWKSNIEKHELPGDKTRNETVTELSRKLSVCTVMSSGDPANTKAKLLSEPKQKMPANRAVELILKWKDVDIAEKFVVGELLRRARLCTK